MNFIREMITRKNRPSDCDDDFLADAQEPLMEDQADQDAQKEQESFADKELVSTLTSIQSKLRGESSPLENASEAEAEIDDCIDQLDDFADVVAARADQNSVKPKPKPAGVASETVSNSLDNAETAPVSAAQKRTMIKSAPQKPALNPEREARREARKPELRQKKPEHLPTKVRPGLQDMPDVAPAPKDQIQVPSPSLTQEGSTSQPSAEPNQQNAQAIEKLVTPFAQSVVENAVQSAAPQADELMETTPERHQMAPQPEVQQPEPTQIEPPKPDVPDKVAATKDPEPKVVQVPAPAAGRAGRRAGRVKTRLLGFEHSDGIEENPFDAQQPATNTARTSFPVGWIVVVKGPGRGTYFPLFNGVSQIGRGDDQAIRLDFGDSSISRSNHAAIAYDSEQRGFYLGHGGKANLVRLNNKPVLSTESISNSDIVRIGETTLRFVGLCGEDFDWEIENQDEFDDAANA